MSQQLSNHSCTAVVVNRHRCRRCGKLFKLKKQLKTHSCPSTTTRRGGSSGQLSIKFKDQLITHGGSTADAKRHHSCHSCGKRFKLKHHLTAHQLVHTGQKPFACPHCRQLFRQQAHLLKHVRDRHNTRDSKLSPSTKLACRSCGKGFPSAAKLDHHMRHATHAAAGKKYPCPVCGKELSRSKLRPHVARVHNSTIAGAQALPHGCQLCEKRFASPYYLQRHQRQRHRDELKGDAKNEHSN
jgi:KRAB domain-containing zinc finger protein